MAAPRKQVNYEETEALMDFDAYWSDYFAKHREECMEQWQRFRAKYELTDDEVPDADVNKFLWMKDEQCSVKDPQWVVTHLTMIPTYLLWYADNDHRVATMYENGCPKNFFMVPEGTTFGKYAVSADVSYPRGLLHAYLYSFGGREPVTVYTTESAAPDEVEKGCAGTRIVPAFSRTFSRSEADGVFYVSWGTMPNYVLARIMGWFDFGSR
jgi:hypothetical protein